MESSLCKIVISTAEHCKIMAWKWFLLKSFHGQQLLRCGDVGKPTNIYINYSNETGSGYTDICAKGKHEIKIRLEVGANVT